MERINENMKKDWPQDNQSRQEPGRYHDQNSSAFISQELFNQNELLKELLRDDIAEGM